MSYTLSESEDVAWSLHAVGEHMATPWPELSERSRDRLLHQASVAIQKIDQIRAMRRTVFESAESLAAALSEAGYRMEGVWNPSTDTTNYIWRCEGRPSIEFVPARASQFKVHGL